VLPPQFHEVGVVSFLDKDVFAVVAAIIDMKEGSVGEGWNVGGHVLIIRLHDKT
jgi:hypothetical protein